MLLWFVFFYSEEVTTTTEEVSDQSDSLVEQHDFRGILRQSSAHSGTQSNNSSGNQTNIEHTNREPKHELRGILRKPSIASEPQPNIESYTDSLDGDTECHEGSSENGDGFGDGYADSLEGHGALVDSYSEDVERVLESFSDHSFYDEVCIPCLYSFF